MALVVWLLRYSFARKLSCRCDLCDGAAEVCVDFGVRPDQTLVRVCPRCAAFRLCVGDVCLSCNGDAYRYIGPRPRWLSEARS